MREIVCCQLDIFFVGALLCSLLGKTNKQTNKHPNKQLCRHTLNDFKWLVDLLENVTKSGRV